MRPRELAVLPRIEKIRPAHLERLAVVYVRQSTPQQVLHHQESTRLQYGLAARAVDLGWPEDRVLVIDDDQGRSGSSAEGRAGFQRLVAEVGMDHVGIILGIEMSRLARSCKDWHHLLEICSLFGTLIADLDGVYAPGDYNDRLLLGLKGTMSEAELHVLHQRMAQGKLNKARRGELNFNLPIGYVRRASGELRFDPDEQVQEVVRLVFRKYEELGTIRAVLRYMVDNGIQLGVRIHSGSNKGDLQWNRPNTNTLRGILHNPFYAGAYAYGRRAVDPRRKKPGRPSTGIYFKPPPEIDVLLRDHHPAYISWEQHDRNLARMKENQSRAETRGAVRRGPSLLAGLLVCGRCGRRLQVSYHGRGVRHAYTCMYHLQCYGEPLCQHMSGEPLDDFVVARVLEVLTPAALELSIQATEHVERERAEMTKLWQQRLERAAYDADRAGRHCRAVEPENRLVARQLEREWEEALATVRSLEEEFRRFEQARPRLLTVAEREAIRRLASDIPTLWSASTTTAVDRKAIVRQIIAQVVVDTVGESEHVRVCIHWAGGDQTNHVMIRPVKNLNQLSTYPQLCERVRELAGEGLDPGGIAKRLEAEGFRTPKRRERFHRKAVRDLMRQLGVGAHRDRPRPLPNLAPHEWLVPDLARHLRIPPGTLYVWARRGLVQVRHVDARPKPRAVLWADEAVQAALRERHGRGRGYYNRLNFLETETGSGKATKGSENDGPQA